MSRLITIRPALRNFAALVVLAVGLALVPLAPTARSDNLEEQANDLIVHEWGTFLGMSGSDGVGLEGMYHEEHSLPGFVHARSREQLRLPSVLIKGETPVIYFYTERARNVRVDVRFPTGIWTQWFPQALLVGPQFTQVPHPSDLRDGRIRWYAALIPPGKEDIKLPETSSDALWNFARDVDAAFVRTHDHTTDPAVAETDRFLFYRGLGRAPLPLHFAAKDGGTLTVEARERFGVAHVFVLRVENGKGAYAYRPSLRPGEHATGAIPDWDRAEPLEQFSARLADDLAARLVESGLFAKEARAMVNTWRSSYFQTPGVRALFILPQAWTDESIPLAMKPRPHKIVRVMVGRTELLTPEREQRAEQAIRDLTSPESETRRRGFDELRDQGRYVEPIIRRVLRSSEDETVKMQCRALLGAEFVTELKAALRHAPTDPRMLSEDRDQTRAQLALLLRELGRDAEAESEARAVLAALRAKPAPDIRDSDFRGYSRAYARAMEASGDLAGASLWYDRFVEFGSQAVTSNDCRFCHQDAGPRDAGWFRSWWAGPKYAGIVARTEGVETAIERLQKSPRTPANRLRLAYLLEAQNKKSQAALQWRELDRAAANARVATAR